MRRPSLEYTFGSGEEGRHREGVDGKEANFEGWNPPKSSKDAMSFQITGGAEEEEYAALHVKPETYRSTKGVKADAQWELGSKGRSKGGTGGAHSTSPRGAQRLPNVSARGSARSSARNSVESNTSVKERQRKGPSPSPVKQPSARERPTTARRKEQQRGKPAQTIASRASPRGSGRRPVRPQSAVEAHRRSGWEKDISVEMNCVPGQRISREHRIFKKQEQGVANLKSRVRRNVQERIRYLDERSEARWKISAKLEYEERLSQGIHVVPRSDKIDWFQEKVFKDDGTAARRKEAEEHQARLRRARCSLSCATLFREDERTQFISGAKPRGRRRRKPHT